MNERQLLQALTFSDQTLRTPALDNSQLNQSQSKSLVLYL